MGMPVSLLCMYLTTDNGCSPTYLGTWLLNPLIEGAKIAGYLRILPTDCCVTLDDAASGKAGSCLTMRPSLSMNRAIQACNVHS
jgi:hypothetical protein